MMLTFRRKFVTHGDRAQLVHGEIVSKAEHVIKAANSLTSRLDRLFGEIQSSWSLES